MDSKQPLPSYQQLGNPDAPPSYDESFSGPCALNPGLATNGSSYNNQIQAQLSQLITSITSIETQKNILVDAKEKKILAHLTKEVQTYLSEFSKTGLRKGTLILIPNHCLENEEAQPCRFEKPDPDKYDRFVTVGDKETLDRGRWFWKDEGMARRMAGYLKPFPDLPSRKADAQVSVTAVSPYAKAKSNSFWRRKSSAAVVMPQPVLADEMDEAVEPKDKVIMDVVTEEVVFRFEDDWGLLKSQSGYGIVLEVKVVMT